MSSQIQFSQVVQNARAENKPIVALESTIITHGMPWPENFETARAVEQAVLDRGAIPATIAILDGVLHIGLTNAQLQTLAKQKEVMKLSRADFAFAISQRKTGSTTVAATMMAAAMAGIDVFATGGIGGVHRGAADSMDISADLTELGKTNVIVVCAGAKAILDLDKTLEVLETKGVPVIGFATDSLPAFWSRESHLQVPLRLDTAGDIAEHAKTRAALGIKGGTLVVNPVPRLTEIPADEIASYIDAALNEAENFGIKGKAVTPFLLSKVAELSDGRSLKTNIALITNNARLAADIAIATIKLG